LGVQVTVLLFASVADRAGTRRLELPSQPGDTVGNLRDRLVDRFPQLEPMVPNLLYALDEEYVRINDPVPPGSTLAVIPPVSGG
jgi:molybdopterin converting factor subunit 1